MNKIPRFMREYASFAKKGVDQCGLMKESKREEIRQRIDKALSFYQRGKITVGEAMMIINNA